MYAAYQSHQSCGGATASNAPWRIEVSSNSCERSATSTSGLPSPPREAVVDLLENPGVAVRVGERRGCPVGALAFRHVDARWRRHHLDVADRDAAADEVVAGGIDVADDQDRALGGAGLGVGAAAELDRARRVGRR